MYHLPSLASLRSRHASLVVSSSGSEAPVPSATLAGLQVSTLDSATSGELITTIAASPYGGKAGRAHRGSMLCTGCQQLLQTVVCKRSLVLYRETGHFVDVAKAELTLKPAPSNSNSSPFYSLVEERDIVLACLPLVFRSPTATGVHVKAHLILAQSLLPG